MTRRRRWDCGHVCCEIRSNRWHRHLTSRQRCLDCWRVMRQIRASRTR
jgi:hypothetical protein